MKRGFLLLALVVLVLGSMTVSASAWVFVPDYGETGWKTFTYTAGPGGFSGIAGFLISNNRDELLDSILLVDNLSHCSQSGNESFEFGNYDGYTLGSESYGMIVKGPVYSYAGNPYMPTNSEWMSQQFSKNDLTPAVFKNAFGESGTNCSYLETKINLAEGQSFTFDWAFLAFDYTPFHDFSVFYLKDPDGNVVFQAGLGQIAPVPAPAVVLLFGSGLLGMRLMSWIRFGKLYRK